MKSLNFFFLFLFLVSSVYSKESIAHKVKGFSACLLVYQKHFSDKETALTVSKIQKELWLKPDITLEELEKKTKNIRGLNEVEKCYDKYITHY